MPIDELFVFAHLQDGFVPTGRLRGLSQGAGQQPARGGLPHRCRQRPRGCPGCPPVARRWRPSRHGTGLVWPAKFPSRPDTFDMATAEYATLRLAALCGMSVPEVRVADIGGKSVLLIRRFDRYWHEGPDLPSSETVLHDTLPRIRAQERRLPFASGLTLLAGDEFESRFKALRRPEPRGTPARASRPHPCRQQGALCADGLQHLRQQRRRPPAQQLRQWRTHFESFGIPGPLIDVLAAGIRDLGDIASPGSAHASRTPSPRGSRTRGPAAAGWRVAPRR